MLDNRDILRQRLVYLKRMREDLEFSTKKMEGPLSILIEESVYSLSAEQRETLAAFNARFAMFQEQLGKTMRAIAIEEEVDTTPFGNILALMERLNLLDNAAQWHIVRDLRNSSAHHYEDNKHELIMMLQTMLCQVEFLLKTHDQMRLFIETHYT